MPNRLIKSSIHESEKVNQMTDFQFRVWVNLITYVDDYGRGDARPAIIKGNCFPLRERITSKDIDAALAGLAGIGCIGLYKVDGRSYLYFPNWEKHQNVRNKQSKFPAPDEADADLQTDEIICKQLPANAPVIQSESISESISESETRPRVGGWVAKFEIFWQAYPKKVGKGAAEKCFERIRPDDVLFTAMLNAVSKAKSSPQWTKDGGQYIPNPATWLNQKRWEDEPMKAMHQKTDYQRREYQESDFRGMEVDLSEELAAMKAAGQ